MLPSDTLARLRLHAARGWRWPQSLDPQVLAALDAAEARAAQAEAQVQVLAMRLHETNVLVGRYSMAVDMALRAPAAEARRLLRSVREEGNA